ncbi:MAG TPA: carboxylesterase family protein [Acidimicrobiales bacterium]
MRTTATTTAGPVRGAFDERARHPDHAPDGVVVFRAIPYAAPPVGPLRWHPPHPPSPWHDPRDATRVGPAAPQPLGGPLEGLVPGMAVGDTDEDCLTLDVWTPAVDGAARPVLVWLHGGAFTIGAGSLESYDGARLAANEDVVVVSVNYRLGALGFLLIDHPDATANCGLLDQIAALEWVRDNIAAFGGDPGRVAVFGESAGAGSVMSLLSTTRSAELFHAAIVQSGATDLVLDRERALEVSRVVAQHAGIDPRDLAAWRALPVDAVLDAQVAAASDLLGTVGMMPFHPTVDGDVLEHDWLGAARAGISRDVALLIGTTRDEMALFASFDPTNATLDAEGLRRRVARLHPDPDAVLAAYAEADDREGPVTPGRRWTAIQTDTAMWMPALRIAEAHASNQPDTWMYRFDWTAADERLGACHGIDIPFPFDTLDRAGWDSFVADWRAARQLARAQQAAWAAMARQGAPSTDLLPPWPRYDATRRATMILAAGPHVEHDPRGAVRAVWTRASTLPA